MGEQAKQCPICGCSLYEDVQMKQSIKRQFYCGKAHYFGEGYDDYDGICHKSEKIVTELQAENQKLKALLKRLFNLKDIKEFDSYFMDDDEWSCSTCRYGHEQHREGCSRGRLFADIRAAIKEGD